MKRLNILITILLTAISCAAQVGRELYRPLYHYSPAYNWMNDPNGLVYYNGKYHLFYQYNPLGSVWGNTSWGHAVSTDLINWEEKPVAIPMQNGIMAFSGSVVVDWNNTSGFGIDGKPPLVAIYTGAHSVQDQRVAYSNDEGLSWTNYSGNPVISSNNNQFRDPKVFWHKETGNWIMAVALGFNNKIGFYKSADLKKWTLLHSFGNIENISGGFWECPDLFKLYVDDDTTKPKWVLIHSSPGIRPTQYFIGDFDGERFTWTSPPPNGIVIEDFESTDYEDWIVSGTAFGFSPASGNLSTQKTVSGFLGTRLVNSFHVGNESQGKLTSPGFTIHKNYINFLIGGGNQPSSLYIKLVVNGETVRKSTGDNDDYVAWKHWDVSNYVGQTAHIEIVDSSTGLWGHINIDHILQSDVIVDKVNTGQIDRGMDFFASQSFSDIPAADGRRIWL
ncbi:MAG TPA: glycoside hydrolase family 32 protein, partial [Chitinophagaceae bacterium]|nr:glycoside hydrolase family 32 protein [Chitinophagaceae bacterium]